MIAAALAAVAVLFAYAYFGSDGTLRFRLITWGESYYASLAEGFFHGRLSMAHEPAPELAKIAEPYVFENREGVPSLWDASYFEGRYYLYFSPLPVILFFIPVRLIAGGYPSDALATTFFVALSFLILVALLRRVRPAHLPLWLWILLIGVGNVIPYVLIASMFYQVAIACAMTFTAAWAYALFRFHESRSARWAIAMGTFLGLAIATRPNLAVLLLVQVLVLIRQRPKTWLAVAAPLFVIACALGAYNYARFRSPTELGVSYQLTRLPMRDRRVCSVCTPREVLRLVNGVNHYLFWTPAFHTKFPFAEVQWHRLDPEVSYPGRSEPITGIAAVTPIVMVGTAFAVLLVLAGGRDARRRAGGTPALLVLAGWIVLIALASCWWVTARYTLDFLGLLVAGSILCTEEGLTYLAGIGVSVRPLRWLCALLAVWSIALGLLLPFSRVPLLH